MAEKLISEITSPAKSFAAYREFNEAVYSQTVDAAASLRGKHVIHINSTAEGGGVAELLHSQVALERDLGLASRWLVIHPAVRFFDITKKIHNLLQGAAGALTPDEETFYYAESARLLEALQQWLSTETVDIFMIHDPQPLCAVGQLPTKAQKIVRLHIDVCNPNQTMIDWLCSLITKTQHSIISRGDCRPACFAPTHTSIITPAIDPLSPKNIAMNVVDARDLLKRHGIDTGRPLISQISRFDQWKDPIGVIKAYQQAKQKIKNLQLVLVGFIQAIDDPEAEQFFKEVEKQANGDPTIYLFYDVAQLKDTTNDTFVNAVQTVSDIVIQKSTREGFGMTVTEAMWKGKPVIGGNVGGIPLQITNDKNGVLVNTPKEAATAIIRLLQDPALQEKLGRAAHTSVQNNFLTPSYILQHLKTYQTVLTT